MLVITEFTKLGKWYEYFTGDSLTVTDTGGPVELQPGEYRLYTTKRLPKPIGGYKKYSLTDISDIKTTIDFSVFPNPAQTDKIEINYALAANMRLRTSDNRIPGLKNQALL